MCFISATSIADSFVPVLVYHRVSDVDKTELTVSIDTFKEHLNIINQYQTITISQLTNDLIEQKISSNRLALTFDDGWRDQYENAVPLLKHNNMSATFYIISDTVAHSTKYGELYLTKEQLRNMSNNPLFEIGSHTDTHFVKDGPILSNIQDSAFNEELFKSKQILEEITERPVFALSWPFGYYRNSLFELAKKNGYTSSVILQENVTLYESISLQPQPMKIARILIFNTCTGEKLKTILNMKILTNCS